MESSCSVCLKHFDTTDNKLVTCGNCDIIVHQGCYGILKLPNFGKWFCRKCESQVRMSKIKCDFCPFKNGAFKRSNSTRCGKHAKIFDCLGWSHVVCALFIPEAKFADNQNMDLVLSDYIPTERYNKSCIFCERNNRNTMSTYGACIQCSWKSCKANLHATCAAQAGLVIAPPSSLCNSKNTLAMLLKGSSSERDLFELSKGQQVDLDVHVFCSSAHMTKHTQTLLLSPSMKMESLLDSTSEFFKPLHGDRNSAFSNFKSAVETLSLTHPPNQNTFNISDALPDDKGCPSPLDQSKKSELSLIQGNDAAFTTTALPKKPNEAKLPVSSPAAANSEDAIGCRRVPRRNAAVLANQEFAPHRHSSSAMPLSAANGIATDTRSCTSAGGLITVPSSVRSRLSATSSGSVPGKLTISAKRKASLAARVRQARGAGHRRSLPSRVSHSRPVPARPVGRPLGASKGTIPVGTEASGTTACTTGYTAMSCGRQSTTYNSDLHLVPPKFPLRIRGFGMPLTTNAATGGQNSHSSNTNNSASGVHSVPDHNPLSTIEFLLEWQWEQGGTLLMQQAEGTDVVSLLNCLHQLKAENDELEAKLIRLQSKREHLKSVNVRLSASLSTLGTLADQSTQSNSSHQEAQRISSEMAGQKRSASPLGGIREAPKNLVSQSTLKSTIVMTSTANALHSSGAFTPAPGQYRPLLPSPCSATVNSNSQPVEDRTSQFLVPISCRSASDLEATEKPRHLMATTTAALISNRGSSAIGPATNTGSISSVLQHALGCVGGLNSSDSASSSTAPYSGRFSLPIPKMNGDLTGLPLQSRPSEPLSSSFAKLGTSSVLPRLQPRATSSVASRNSNTVGASSSPRPSRVQTGSTSNSYRPVLPLPSRSLSLTSNAPIVTTSDHGGYLPPVSQLVPNGSVNNSNAMPVSAASDSESSLGGAGDTHLVVSSLENVVLVPKSVSTLMQSTVLSSSLLVASTASSEDRLVSTSANSLIVERCRENSISDCSSESLMTSLLEHANNSKFSTPAFLGPEVVFSPCSKRLTEALTTTECD